MSGGGPIDAMCSSILPAYPPLEGEQRKRVEGDVSRYVAAQIERMPAHLAIPYRFGLTVFDLLAVVRFFQRFRTLEVAVGRRYIGWWADSPIVLMRDLVKPIRTMVLFSFFDHPEVRRALEEEQSALLGPGF